MKYRLRNGDLVKFGRTCFRVKESEPKIEDKRSPIYSSDMHLGGFNTTKPEPPEEIMDVSVCSGVATSTDEYVTTS